MFSVIFSFLGTPLGKIVGYLGAGIALALVIWAGIAIHDSNVRKEALAKYNQTQIEQNLKDTKALIEETKKINENQNKIILEVQSKNQKLDEALSKIDNYLNEPETIKQDKESSNILKNTIKSLRGGK